MGNAIFDIFGRPTSVTNPNPHKTQSSGESVNFHHNATMAEPNPDAATAAALSSNKTSKELANTVLLGRGKSHLNHPGNKYFQGTMIPIIGTLEIIVERHLNFLFACSPV